MKTLDINEMYPLRGSCWVFKATGDDKDFYYVVANCGIMRGEPSVVLTGTQYGTVSVLTLTVGAFILRMQPAAEAQGL